MIYLHLIDDLEDDLEHACMSFFSQRVQDRYPLKQYWNLVTFFVNMLVLARPIPFLLLNGILTGAGIWVMGRRSVDGKTDFLASIPGGQQPDLLHEDEVNREGAPAAAAHDEIEEGSERAPLHLQHDPPASNLHAETDTADNHAVTQRREHNELFHPSNVEAPVLLLADASVVDETAALLELGEDVDEGFVVGSSTSSSDSLRRMDDDLPTTSSFRGRASIAARATASNYRRPHGKLKRQVVFSNLPAGTTQEHQVADVDLVDGLLHPSFGCSTR